MTVTRYAAINLAGVSLSAHPVHYICTTTAELPSSGLKLGDTAVALDTNIWYKAASTSTWAQTSSTVVASTLVVKAADESVTSSTTLQNDNHLFFPIAANEVWLVTGTYFMDSASTSPGAKLGLAVPAGCSVLWNNSERWSWQVSETMNTGLIESGTYGLATINAGAYLGDPAMFKYLVRNGSTAGNFQLTWAQLASNASATTMRRYSTLAGLKLA